MAGPGFDFFTDHNHKDAADNVQCYSSSIDKGSRFYNCHQNIRLGQCGYTQPASLTQSLYSSHGLCVQIYINAFDHPFYALQNPPRWCATANPAQNLPKYFTIGYKESGYRWAVQPSATYANNCKFYFPGIFMEIFLYLPVFNIHII